jgi:hypothetical protein
MNVRPLTPAERVDLAAEKLLAARRAARGEVGPPPKPLVPPRPRWLVDREADELIVAMQRERAAR